MFKKYLLYLLRWQLSTPILALVLWLMRGWPYIAATVVANLIGGLIFFWIDRLIFQKEKDSYTTADRYDLNPCYICHGFAFVYKGEGAHDLPAYRVACMQCGRSTPFMTIPLQDIYFGWNTGKLTYDGWMNGGKNGAVN